MKKDSVQGISDVHTRHDTISELNRCTRIRRVQQAFQPFTLRRRRVLLPDTQPNGNKFKVLLNAIPMPNHLNAVVVITASSLLDTSPTIEPSISPRETAAASSNRQEVPQSTTRNSTDNVKQPRSSACSCTYLQGDLHIPHVLLIVGKATREICSTVVSSLCEIIAVSSLHSVLECNSWFLVCRLQCRRWRL